MYLESSFRMTVSTPVTSNFTSFSALSAHHSFSVGLPTLNWKPALQSYLWHFSSTCVSVVMLYMCCVVRFISHGLHPILGSPALTHLVIFIILVCVHWNRLWVFTCIESCLHHDSATEQCHPPQTPSCCPFEVSSFYPPRSLKTIYLSSIPVVLPVPEWHVNTLIQHTALCV